MDEFEWPDMGPVIEVEHKEHDSPVGLTLLRRSSHGYAERMSIAGYPAVALILVTCPGAFNWQGNQMPGVIRELPVGFRDLASEETFLARIEKVIGNYEAHDWVRVPEEATC